MATENQEVFKDIAACIPADQVRRRSEAGRSFDYITARTVMNRLDSVVGAECWWDTYEIIDTKEVAGSNRPTWFVTVRCKLSVQVAGAVITKEGIGCEKHVDLSVAVMGGESTALKRAGVKFGIARELYGDGVACYDVDESLEPAPPAKQASPKPAPPAQRQAPPAQRPPAQAPAQPRATGPTPAGIPQAEATKARGAMGKFDTRRDPNTGKSMFAWIMAFEEKGCEKLFFRLRQWLKERGWPDRLDDLDPAQFQAAIWAVRQKVAVDLPSEGLPGIKPLSEEDWPSEETDAEFRAFLARLADFSAKCKTDYRAVINHAFGCMRAAGITKALAQIPGEGPDMVQREAHLFLANKQWPVYATSLIRRVGAELKPKRDAVVAKELATVGEGAFQ